MEHEPAVAPGLDPAPPRMMRYQVTGLYRQCSECKAPVFLMNNDLNFKQSLTIFEENGTMWITPHVEECPEWYGD